MGVTLTTFDSALKEDYSQGIVYLLNNKNRLKKECFGGVGKGQVEAGGRRVVFPIHYGRNTGVGSVAEGNSLPTGGNQSFAEARVTFKYTYLRIQLTAQTIKQSRTDKMAFAKAMEVEMKQAVQDGNRLVNRQLFGFGVGIMCKADGTQTTSATLNVKDPYGVAISDRTGAARLLQAGEWIAAVRNATPTSATDSDIIWVKQISSISADGKTITLTAVSGATTNDGDMIVLAPAGGDSVTTESSVNKEPMGLLGIADDGTYLTTLHNISRTTYPQYKSYVQSVNGDLTMDGLQQAYDSVDEKSGMEITHLICHHSVRRSYLNQLQVLKRYVNQMAMSPDGGFKGGAISSDIEFNEKPVVAERMAPLGMIFGINKTEGKRYLNSEGWADDDGRILLRVSNKDTYEGRFRIFDNYSNDRPDACFRLDSVNATYVHVPVE